MLVMLRRERKKIEEKEKRELLGNPGRSASGALLYSAHSPARVFECTTRRAFRVHVPYKDLPTYTEMYLVSETRTYAKGPGSKGGIRLSDMPLCGAQAAGIPRETILYRALDVYLTW